MHSKKLSLRSACPLFISLLMQFGSTWLSAQERSDHETKPLRNRIGVYLGLLEINLNYERNIIQRPKSYSNIRIGIGSFTDLQFGGKYINASLIQLLGKRKSHAEVDLGCKLFLAGTNLNFESPRTFLIPDIYVGYRYENPENREFFRIGFSFPSLINVGGGFKF